MKIIYLMSHPSKNLGDFQKWVIQPEWNTCEYQIAIDLLNQKIVKVLGLPNK